MAVEISQPRRAIASGWSSYDGCPHPPRSIPWTLTGSDPWPESFPNARTSRTSRTSRTVTRPLPSIPAQVRARARGATVRSEAVRERRGV
eukprot:3937430-Rhodomonas_salina.2